jgi:hypothetical protein
LNALLLRGFALPYRLAPRRIVQLRIIIRELLGRLDVQRREHRAILLEHMRGLLLEIGQLRELVGVRIAGRARHAGEIRLRVGDRMPAVRLVGVVLHHDVDKVLRRRRRDRHQAAEIHQEAAVALQADDALVRPPKCEAECM